MNSITTIGKLIEVSLIHNLGSPAHATAVLNTYDITLSLRPYNGGPATVTLRPPMDSGNRSIVMVQTPLGDFVVTKI